MSIEDKKWAQLAEAQQYKRLETIRATAGNWRTGLIALTALLTTVTILKGPEKASDLSDEGKLYAALLLGAALLLLLIGSAAAMFAAFGLPGADDLVTGEKLRKWTAKASMHAKRWLYIAVACFFLAVPAVAGAVAITWFDEDLFAGDPAAVVVIELKPVNDEPQPPVCGELKRGNDTVLVLEVDKPAGKRDQTIALTDVEALAIKSDCPS